MTGRHSNQLNYHSKVIPFRDGKSTSFFIPTNSLYIFREIQTFVAGIEYEPVKIYSNKYGLIRPRHRIRNTNDKIATVVFLFIERGDIILLCRRNHQNF